MTMELIDKNKIDFCTIETDDFSGNQIIEVVFKEDIEELPTVKAIPVEVINDILKKLHDLSNHKIAPISFDQGMAIDMCIDIINKTIAESEGK
jgi:hypothetical protein